MQRRRAGFSLVEVMIAVGIFAVAMLGSLLTVNTEWEFVRRTQERLYVSRILESRLEEIRDLTFDELLALTSPVQFAVLPATTIFGRDVNPAVDDTNYKRDLRNASGQVVIENIGTALQRVTVEVTWDQGIRGGQVSMNTVTYVTRNGVSRQ